jgi:hypothetical protein
VDGAEFSNAAAMRGDQSRRIHFPQIWQTHVATAATWAGFGLAADVANWATISPPGRKARGVTQDRTI